MILFWVLNIKYVQATQCLVLVKCLNYCRVGFIYFHFSGRFYFVDDCFGTGSRKRRAIIVDSRCQRQRQSIEYCEFSTCCSVPFIYLFFVLFLCCVLIALRWWFWICLSLCLCWWLVVVVVVVVSGSMVIVRWWLIAVDDGNFEIVDMLIESGADVDEKDSVTCCVGCAHILCLCLKEVVFIDDCYQTLSSSLS